MSKRPDSKPSDYRYQDSIDKSWDPKLKKGDDFWVFNEKTLKIFGPYKFSYYTPLGAVGWCNIGYRTGIKVRYSKGEVVCATEKIAVIRQLVQKTRKYLDLCREADILKEDIEQLSSKLNSMGDSNGC